MIDNPVKCHFSNTQKQPRQPKPDTGGMVFVSTGIINHALSSMVSLRIIKIRSTKC